jgi:outer membrane protein assembly factor BamB
MTASDIQVFVRALDGTVNDPTCAQVDIPIPGTFTVVVDFSGLSAVAVWLDIYVAGTALEPKQVYGRLQTPGKLLWKAALLPKDGNCVTFPVMGPDNTVLLTVDPSLICFDGLTGERLWSLDSACGYRTWVSERPLYNTANQLIVMENDTSLIAVNVRTGAVNWRRRFPGTKSLRARNDIVVVYMDFQVIVVDGRTGEQLWSVQIDVAAIPVIGSDGTVYLAISSNEVEAHDGLTGEVKWRFKLEEGNWSTSFCIDDDGQMYVGVEKRVIALNREGEQVWSRYLDWPSYKLTCHSACKTLYVGSHFGTVCLDTVTGDVVWKREGLSKIHVTDALSNMVIGTGEMDDCVIAVDGLTGKTAWSWEHDGSKKKKRFFYCAIASNGTVFALTYSSLYAIA